MAKKKKDNTWMWGIGIIIGLLILWNGGEKGWFKSEVSITNQNPQQTAVPNPTNTPTNNQWTPLLSFTITPMSGCIGDLYSGTVNSNMPDASCTTYVNDIIFDTYHLDANGQYSTSTNINTGGVANIFVTCRYNNVNYDAPVKQITVNACYTCTDTDGTNVLVFGNCEDSYHMAGFPDSCYSLAQVREYMCGSDNICMNAIITCPAGMQCRDGRCQ